MAVIRRNIVTNTADRDNYIRGVKLLKQEFFGSTSTNFGIPGPVVQLSTYDLFVVWHHFAMFTFTPPGQFERNAAHIGPVFLPWHRWMLILFQGHLQRVLFNPNFGLPYWDWAADGQLPLAQQPTQPIWGAQFMGGQGNPVTTGPFAFNPNDPNTWRIRVATNVQSQLVTANRGLRRAFGSTFGFGLPNKAPVGQALQISAYDASPWNRNSGTSFRNRLEGWQAPSPLHNGVHTWVGGTIGDISFSSSPNDPVFYLHHSNVDRIWAAWQQRHPSAPYVPPQTESSDLFRHRINDPMYDFLSLPATPAQMLDVSINYTYDTLVVS